MPILVTCSCGKKLRVKDETAGKRVRCPGCGGIVPVPPALPEHAQAAHEETRDEPFYWVDSTGFSVEMIALSDDALFVASLNEKELKEAKAALKNGMAVPEVLNQAKLVVPYAQMHKVSSNLHHRSVDIYWKEPDAKEEKEKNLNLADKNSRDELLEGLRRRLGDGWKRRVKEFTRLRAAWAPLGVIGLFAAIAVCIVLANLYPDPNPSGTTRRIPWIIAIFLWLYDKIGWVGVTLIFVSFALIGVIWFVMRMLKPPLMYTLMPKEKPKGRA